MAEFMAHVAQRVNRVDGPATVYYAYKATETKRGGDPHHGMGHVPARQCSGRGAASQRYMANTHRVGESAPCLEDQCVGVFGCPSLSAAGPRLRFSLPVASSLQHYAKSFQRR